MKSRRNASTRRYMKSRRNASTRRYMKSRRNSSTRRKLKSRGNSSTRRQLKSRGNSSTRRQMDAISRAQVGGMPPPVNRLRGPIEDVINLLVTGAGKAKDSVVKESRCVICLTDLATHAMYPCGHLCVCEECVLYFKFKCHLCRQPADALVKIAQLPPPYSARGRNPNPNPNNNTNSNTNSNMRRNSVESVESVDYGFGTTGVGTTGSGTNSNMRRNSVDYGFGTTGFGTTGSVTNINPDDSDSDSDVDI